LSNRTYTTDKHNSTLAIISLVSGITGWSLVPFFGAIIAIITGHMARREITESGGQIEGQGLANTGLALGYGCLGIGLLILCSLLIFIPLGFDFFKAFYGP
jgi:hypothetical protein